jgi:hypothetical protein
MLAAQGCHLGEFPKHRMEKPAEPDAFTRASLADTIHPVIPVSGTHEWKAVTADGKAPVQGASTMFKERGANLGHSRLKIQFMLSLC